jgi:hypothetical protein
VDIVQVQICSVHSASESNQEIGFIAIGESRLCNSQCSGGDWVLVGRYTGQNVELLGCGQDLSISCEGVCEDPEYKSVLFLSNTRAVWETLVTYEA